MTILVTGAAGFIGFHAAKRLLERGESVIGVDDLNPYYDVTLKRARLSHLERQPGFRFHRLSVADPEAMAALFARHNDIGPILHLAAQAGVRYSLTNPFAYVEANVLGQLVLLETARKLKGLSGITYASSSSVYGGNEKQPFSVRDRTDRPLSLYAATKRSAELVSEAYASLYGLALTGLRFFTVYGPWGRPDMAYSLFTEAILKGEPITVFNKGRMKRDFTYIDDILPAIVTAIEKNPARPGENRLYNLGKGRPEPLSRFIALLEREIGKKAVKRFLPMQPGDAVSTFADIEEARADLAFAPKTSLAEGLSRFVVWYKEYHGIESFLPPSREEPLRERRGRAAAGPRRSP